VPIFDRYVAKEILLPFSAGLLFLTQLLLATQVLNQADVLFGSAVSFADIGFVLLSLIPNVLGYLLPVCFLLGCVIGIGRLSEDREIVAMGAAGLSTARLVRVPVALGILVAAFATWFSTHVEPAGYGLARDRLSEVVKKNVASDVRSGTFYDQIPGYTLYAEHVKPGGGWQNVLISDRSNEKAPVLALARTGRLEPVGLGQEMRLVLDSGELHREQAASDEYAAADFRHAEVVVGLGTALSDKNAFSRSTKEMTMAAIDQRIVEERARRTREGDATARKFEGYKHRRYAQPFAILAFSLLAVPLGAARKVGRTFAMAATVGAMIAQYILMKVGETLAQNGALPAWLALQLPTVVLSVLGVVLIVLQARRGVGAVR
jgi:lipopolysaccharide export system permease protein